MIKSLFLCQLVPVWELGLHKLRSSLSLTHGLNSNLHSSPNGINLLFINHTPIRINKELRIVFYPEYTGCCGLPCPSMLAREMMCNSCFISLIHSACIIAVAGGPLWAAQEPPPIYHTWERMILWGLECRMMIPWHCLSGSCVELVWC